jgi:hypothetical protein
MRTSSLDVHRTLISVIEAGAGRTRAEYRRARREHASVQQSSFTFTHTNNMILPTFDSIRKAGLHLYGGGAGSDPNRLLRRRRRSRSRAAPVASINKEAYSSSDDSSTDDVCGDSDGYTSPCGSVATSPATSRGSSVASAPKKSVSFYGQVAVVLIPTREEVDASATWWSPSDLAAIRRAFYKEVDAIAASLCVNMRVLPVCGEMSAIAPAGECCTAPAAPSSPPRDACYSSTFKTGPSQHSHTTAHHGRQHYRPTARV